MSKYIMYVRTYVRTYVCMYVCMYVCIMYVFVYICKGKDLPKHAMEGKRRRIEVYSIYS